MSQINLFEDTLDTKSNQGPKGVISTTSAPLAFKHRPKDTKDFVGFDQVCQKFPFLNSERPRNVIFWGPPGSGKTTLVYLLAKKYQREIHTLNAVLQGVPDLKKLLQNINMRSGQAIFIDEIHRFNKAQQDALLPGLEKGDFLFFGATTENPFVSLNPALRSRVTIVNLSAQGPEQIAKILKSISEKEPSNFELDEQTINFLARQAGGDTRKAINLLEIAFGVGNDISELARIFRNLNLNTLEYKERYYDLISALIKSMRGSDPQSALLYLACLIHEGHDLIAVCRRLLVFASEDVGNSDPMALSLANATLIALQNIGMPEGRIVLGQTVSYLASTVKSNCAYSAINHALKFVKENEIQVPALLKNKKSSDYLYPHDYPDSFVKQNYSNEPIPNFYKPGEQGREKALKSRLEHLWP